MTMPTHRQRPDEDEDEEMELAPVRDPMTGVLLTEERRDPMTGHVIGHVRFNRQDPS